MPEKWTEKNGTVRPSAPALTLANATKYRVITAAQVKNMIEEAVAKDRQQWTVRIHEETKAKITEARGALQAAIQEIERIKSQSTQLEQEVIQLRGEKESLTLELERLRALPQEPISIPVTPLTQKMLIDSLVSRLNRVETLLAAHLIQDHRQAPPDFAGEGGCNEGPSSNGNGHLHNGNGRNSNGRFRRKPPK